MLVYQRVMFPLEKAIYGGNPDRKNPQVSFRTSQVPSVSTSRRSSMPGKKSTRWCRRIACSSPVTTAVQERNGVGKLGSREAGALGATSEQNWKSLQSQNNTEDLKSCCCVVFFSTFFFPQDRVNLWIPFRLSICRCVSCHLRHPTSQDGCGCFLTWWCPNPKLKMRWSGWMLEPLWKLRSGPRLMAPYGPISPVTNGVNDIEQLREKYRTLSFNI